MAWPETGWCVTIMAERDATRYSYDDNIHIWTNDELFNRWIVCIFLTRSSLVQMMLWHWFDGEISPETITGRRSYIWKVSYGLKQGKSEGFESCDRPTVGKCPIWVKIGDVLYRVTLKFDGWPWKTIGHLSFAVSSFVQHFIAIGEFKLELQSGNTQFGSNLMIFRAVWPWNLTDDLQKH